LVAVDLVALEKTVFQVALLAQQVLVEEQQEQLLLNNLQ
jgi:hypothetical protein